jgi:hypothetical protein
MLIHAVEHQFAVFLGRDVVTAAELRSNLSAVLGRRRLAERPLLLFDFRQVATLELQPEHVDDLCRIVEGAGPLAKGARFAIVAERELVSSAAEGFVALAAALPIEVKLFREIAEARSWLAYADVEI